LKQRGYVSFQGGKHWEGPYGYAGFTHGTSKEEAHGFGATAIGGKEGVELGRVTMQPLYDFIDEHGEVPFLIWFAPMLPHVPFNAPSKYLELYDEMDLSASAREYYANCSWLDDVVGQLVAYLDEKGLRDKTLIVYLSDNGWHNAPDEDFTGWLIGGPKGKGSMYELGFRTPLIFSWPGRIPSGQTIESLVSSLDVFPTLLDYAGIPTPPDRSGQNLRPLLEGRMESTPRTIIGWMQQSIVTRNPRGSIPEYVKMGSAFFLRNTSWHYVFYAELGEDELYDVRSDPEENKNVASDHPNLVKQFREQISSWELEMNRRFDGKEVAEDSR
jgi:uncharacterized sulfatase